MTKNTFCSLTKTAIVDERDANRMYMKMANMTNNWLLKKLIHDIARDERKHLSDWVMIRKMMCMK